MPPDPAAAAEPAISLLGPQVYPLWLGFSFVVGLLWGSFFNVCIYRAPIGLSPTRPRRSFCFSCGTPIAWFDNIPLLSWLWLRGRCRHCGSRISPRYFVIELLTGALFALLWWSTNRPEVALERGFSAAVFWYAAVAGMLLIGAMTDIDHWIIPDGITRGGLIAALAAALVIPLADPSAIIARAGPFPGLRRANRGDAVEVIGAILGERQAPSRRGSAAVAASPASRKAKPPVPAARPPAPDSDRLRWWEPFANALLGAAVGYGLLWGVAIFGRLLFRREAMGGGDLKLFAFLGAVFGPFNTVLLLFFSSFLGVFLGVGAILWSLARPPRRPSPAQLFALPREPAAPGAPDEPAAPGEPPPAPAAAAEEVPAPPAAPSPEKETARQVEEYLIYARRRPAPRLLHHLPFGPSISLAALILLIFYDPIHEAILAFLFPPF